MNKKQAALEVRRASALAFALNDLLHKREILQALEIDRDQQIATWWKEDVAKALSLATRLQASLARVQTMASSSNVKTTN